MNIELMPKMSLDYMLHKDEGEVPEYFLFNIKDGAVYQINATSYDFLTRCNGERRINEIFQELIKIYSIDQGRLESDFDKLISTWSEMGIIF